MAPEPPHNWGGMGALMSQTKIEAKQRALLAGQDSQTLRALGVPPPTTKHDWPGRRVPIEKPKRKGWVTCPRGGRCSWDECQQSGCDYNPCSRAGEAHGETVVVRT